MDNHLKTACCYIRVSTDQQEEFSPDTQIKRIREYCKNSNILLVDIYQDLGISGRTADKRPEFQKMIATAKSKDHPYDYILVWKFSRFARNQEESIVYKSMLKKDNVEVLSISEPLPDGMIGGLVERIFEWMDEYYSIRLSGEVMRGMSEKASRGGYLTIACYGYDRNPREEIARVNPEQAEVVRHIFQLYAIDGYSFRSIAHKLNAQNIRTKSGKLWDLSSVRYILDNPFYIGKVRWNYLDHTTKLPKPAEEWIIADSKHEAIIDMELWEKAAARLAASRESSPLTGKRHPRVHWLVGFVKCHYCGGPMSCCFSGKPRNGERHRLMRCHNHTSKGTCDYVNSVRLDSLEKLVLSALNDLLNDSHIKLEELQKLRPATLTVDYSAQLRSLDLQEKRIKEAYRNGIDTLDEYKENKALILSERQKIARAIETAPRAAYEDMRDRFKDILGILQSDADILKKHDVLSSFVDIIEYDAKTEQVEISLKL